MSNVAAADSFFGIFGYHRMTEEQAIAQENLKSLGKKLTTWDELEQEVERMRKENSPLRDAPGVRKL